MPVCVQQLKDEKQSPSEYKLNLDTNAKKKWLAISTKTLLKLLLNSVMLIIKLANFIL